MVKVEAQIYFHVTLTTGKLQSQTGTSVNMREGMGLYSVDERRNSNYLQ